MSTIDTASTASRLFNLNMQSLLRSMERLATGDRLTRAGLDPAAMITSERLQAELATLDAMTRSMERADAVATVADGGLAEISGTLSEAHALVVANANTAGLTPEERAANQMQLDALLASVNRAASSTSFNGQALLDGSVSISALGETLALDRVSTSDLGEVTVDGTTYTAADLVASGSLNIVDGDLETAQLVIDQAITDVATARGGIGAFQSNTIATAVAVGNVALVNLAGANALIADTDFASEIANLRRDQLAVSASILAMDVTLDARQSIIDLLTG